GLADFNQGTTSTATYHYINGNTDLHTFYTNGVLQSGVYYVAGDIQLSVSNMSTTTPSNVTLVATGKVNVSVSGNINLTPYQGGMLAFGNTSSGDGVQFSGGSTGGWKGIAYAPHSNVHYSGAQNVVAGGSIVGYTISFSN